MSAGKARNRGTLANGRIRQFFAGRQSRGSQPAYPGDRELRREDGLTIQIHRVDVYDGKVKEGKRKVANVPIVAVYVPAEMAKDWLPRSSS